MELTASVVISRPSGKVFTYLAEPSNNPLWQKGMKRCTWTTAPPIAVGSRYRQEASFLGRPVVSVFEVVAFTDQTSITFETIESTFPIKVSRWVEDRGDGTCRVSAAIEGGPRVPRFLAGLVRRTAQRAVTRDYARLAATFAV